MTYIKYRIYLPQSTARDENSRSIFPIRMPLTHSALTAIPDSAVCPPQYQELKQHLDKNVPYTPVESTEDKKEVREP